VGGLEVLVGVNALEDDRLAAGATALGASCEGQLNSALDSDYCGPTNVQNAHDVLARLDLPENDLSGELSGEYVECRIGGFRKAPETPTNKRQQFLKWPFHTPNIGAWAQMHEWCGRSLA
jgi:hypothetical protein